MNSAYDDFAQQFVARGLCPLPIGPGEKRPKVWDADRGWLGMDDWPTRDPITLPQPGAGIGVRMTSELVAVDLDDDDIAIALLDILPNTPVRKVGARGETLFYRHSGLESRKYLIDERTVCEILAAGCQTVVPPTTHPDGMLYRWSGSKTLLDVGVNDLPELTPEIIDKVEDTLSFYGWSAGSKANGHAGADERKPPVDVEAELAAMRYGSINETMKRVVPSMLQKGEHPQDVADRVVPLIMALEPPNGTVDGDGKVKRGAWSLAEELRSIRARMLCSYKLFMKSYDHTTGVIPSWLPGEFHEPWAEALAAGRRPSFGSNRYRIFVLATGKATDPGAPPRPEESPQAESGGCKRRFKLVSFGDLRPGPEPLYLVDELIPITGLVDVWGKAKCLKSFWCLDLMLHVAMGWEYRDRSVRQGPVVYCAFEGAHGYKKRCEALRRHYAIEDGVHVPLYVMPGQANLITEHQLLVNDIRDQMGGERPVAVVLDTLNKSLVGSENKDVDMGAYVRAAEVIRDAFQCAVIIVHHCGYDETRPRGHSSFPAAVEAQLAVVRSESTLTVTVEMMRDGPEETQVTSLAKSVPVGVDQNGKELTSLVLVPAGADTEPQSVRDRWAKSTVAFMAALREAIRLGGRAHQPGPGVLPVQAAPLPLLRKEFNRVYLDADMEDNAVKRGDRQRAAFKRGWKDVAARGLVQSGREGGRETGTVLAWLCDS